MCHGVVDPMLDEHRPRAMQELLDQVEGLARDIYLDRHQNRDCAKRNRCCNSTKHWTCANTSSTRDSADPFGVRVYSARPLSNRARTLRFSYGGCLDSGESHRDVQGDQHFMRLPCSTVIGCGKCVWSDSWSARSGRDAASQHPDGGRGELRRTHKATRNARFPHQCLARKECSSDSASAGY